MKKEKQYIIDWMYQLDFENAAKHLFQLPEEEQISLMVCEAADTDSIIILGFLSYILSIRNTAFYHQVISEALIQMCWLEGGYNLAFYHACKLLELKPVVEIKEYLLFFNTIPEKLLSEEKAYTLSKEILSEKPDSIAANGIFSRLREKYE